MSIFMTSNGFGLLFWLSVSPPAVHGDVRPDAVVDVAGEVNDEDIREADELCDANPNFPPGMRSPTAPLCMRPPTVCTGPDALTSAPGGEQEGSEARFAACRNA